jgi:ABC-type sugar transport system substrate-binding protein
MPKTVGRHYDALCRRGAEEAARELNRELVVGGIATEDPSAQMPLVQEWIDSGDFQAICVACSHPEYLGIALRDARQKTITVVTFDADSTPEARDRFVNPCRYEAVAQLLVDDMAGQLDPPGEGEVGILTDSIPALPGDEWLRRMREYAAAKYPRLVLLPAIESAGQRDHGASKVKALIGKSPGLKGVIGLTPEAVPAAASAVREAVGAGALRPGQVKVGGVSTPADARPFVADGTVASFVSWNPVDLGYLAVQVADRVAKKELSGPEQLTPPLGRLGPRRVGPKRDIILGEPIRVTRDNIDQLGF